MGLFDKAKDLAAQHRDTIAEGIERAGDLIDEKTGGRYADQIDRGQEFARDRLDGVAGTDEPEPQDPAPADGPPPAS